MKVLALITDAFGGHGGISRYNRDLLSALAALPITTSILAVPRLGIAKPGELPDKVVQTAPVLARTAYVTSALRAVFNSKRFDMVFCGHLYMAPLAAAVSRLIGAPLWLQLYGIEAWERPGRFTQKAVAQARLVTVISRYTRRQFLTWADVEPARVRLLPCTVEPRYAPGPKPVELAKKLDVEGRKILLTVSRLAGSERSKGHDRVIAALPLVLSRHPETVYIVAGDGGDRGRLERHAVATGVSSAVRFMGRVADEDLLDHYRLADVFVMPSTSEGFGIVFLEAAACGLPVIAGNSDGSIDALADGAIGTLVDPDSVEDIAAAICAALAGTASPDGTRVSRFAGQHFARHLNELVRNLH